MGALHEGHLDLVRAAKASGDLTVVSIFVNPTQFNNPDDFANYPHTLEEDLSRLKAAAVDFVFIPSKQTVYPEDPTLHFGFGDLEAVLEGAFRPGHFNGVGIVVSKLFNFIKPHKAFFGQKDLQQVAIINRLINDLSFDVQMVTVPTKREADGLAMSSRNLRLTAEERKESRIIINSLRKAEKELLDGMTWFDIQNQIKRDFRNSPLARLEYFELVHPASFKTYEVFTPLEKSSICIAAFIGNIRLIDNLTIIP